MVKDRLEIAMETFRKVMGDGEGSQEVTNTLNELAPEFAQAMFAFGFGDTYSNKDIDLKTRELCTVAVFTALNREKPLKLHIGACLNLGCSKREIVAVICHVGLLAGFSLSVNGLILAKEVFSERGI